MTVRQTIEALKQLDPEMEFVIPSNNPEHPQSSYKKSRLIIATEMMQKSIPCRDMIDGESYSTDLYVSGGEEKVATIH